MVFMVFDRSCTFKVTWQQTMVFMVFDRSCTFKVTWQQTVKQEDKTSWNKIVEIFRGQYGVHIDPRTAYQCCLLSKASLNQ